MFSLIITVISIALVAALALATIYYGGSAFNRGADGAKAAQLINEGQQVNGAVALARADATNNDATAPATVGDLVTAQYLSQVPANFLSTASLTPVAPATVASIEKTGGIVTDKVCAEVQKRATGSGAIVATKPTDKLFGCYGTAGAQTFFYQL